jgi:hypothetical protein
MLTFFKKAKSMNVCWKWVAIFLFFILTLILVDNYKWILWRWLEGDTFDIADIQLHVPWTYCWRRGDGNSIVLIDAVQGNECAFIEPLDASELDLNRIRSQSLKAGDCFKEHMLDGVDMVEFQATLREQGGIKATSDVVFAKKGNIVIQYFGRLDKKYDLIVPLMKQVLARPGKARHGTIVIPRKTGIVREAE